LTLVLPPLRGLQSSPPYQSAKDPSISVPTATSAAGVGGSPPPSIRRRRRRQPAGLGFLDELPPGHPPAAAEPPLTAPDPPPQTALAAVAPDTPSPSPQPASTPLQPYFYKN
jgi:hypothetical protein